MALAVNLQKVFGRGSSVVDLLTELEEQNGVLDAMDDQDWRGDLFQLRLRVEL